MAFPVTYLAAPAVAGDIGTGSDGQRTGIGTGD